MAKYQRRVVASGASRGHYSDDFSMRAVDATRLVLDRSCVCASCSGGVDQAMRHGRFCEAYLTEIDKQSHLSIAFCIGARMLMRKIALLVTAIRPIESGFRVSSWVEDIITATCCSGFRQMLSVFADIAGKSLMLWRLPVARRRVFRFSCPNYASGDDPIARGRHRRTRPPLLPAVGHCSTSSSRTPARGAKASRN